jgi:alpha-1,2-mannosyltransferase
VGSTTLSRVDSDETSYETSSEGVRALGFGVALLLLALAVFFGAFSLWVARGIDLGDFRFYVTVGEATIRGRALYDPAHAALPTFGGTFKYTPFAAILFTVLPLVPFAVLRVAVLLVDLGAVLGVVWIAWGLLGCKRDQSRLIATLAIGALCLGLQPVAWGMIWGQINLLLMFVVVADLAAPGHRRWKGVGIGLAAGVKLLPVLFIVYLLLTRRVRAAMTATAVLFATVAVGFLVMPTDAGYFWAHYLRSPDLMVNDAGHLENQSVRGELARLLHDGTIPTQEWFPVAALAGCAGLAVAVLAARRGSELAGLTACGITTVLVSPISRSHYWVWFVPALALGAHVVFVTRSRWWAAALGAGYLAVFAWPTAWIWGMPFLGLVFVPRGHHLVSLLCQGMDVWIGLAALAALAGYAKACRLR